MDEFALIYQLIAPGAGRRDDILLGIGDDGALVMPPPGEALVLVLDTLVEGVHFLPTLNPEALGYRLAAVNLSDLAAMGATPLWATLGLTLPRADPDWITAFMRGLSSAFRPFRVALVGGDTTRGPLTLSLQLTGSVPPNAALTRHGARIGDSLWVSGTLGDAAAGLAVARAAEPESAAGRNLRQRFERPEPRVALGLALRGIASACIDISDGFMADLGHLVTRSGVRATVYADRLPLSAALRAERAPGEALQLALGGGDDYELCFTAPPAALPRLHALIASGQPLTEIGEIIEGEGIALLDGNGQALTAPASGYLHFP